MRTIDKVLLLAAVAIVQMHTAGLREPLLAQAAPSMDERVAALKTSLQENQARLRKFEWIETTIISLKGEEKARQQKRCYYGADGKVQKLPIEAQPKQQAQQGGGGGRGGGRLKKKIVENKKDEMQDYMERAGELIQMYLPPNPAQIQQAKDAGKVALKPQDGGRVRLEFAGYLQAGDSLAIDVDGAKNQLSAIALATYLGTPEDPVTLDVKFGSLTDGTSYVAQTTLDAKAKNIRVVVQNSGHRPLVQ